MICGFGCCFCSTATGRFVGAALAGAVVTPVPLVDAPGAIFPGRVSFCGNGERCGRGDGDGGGGAAVAVMARPMPSIVATAVTLAGLPEPVIIAGGSPSFSIHCKRKSIECSPGTFIYWDAGYSDLCPEQKFVPAALVITRVISLPFAGKVCTDLGHKSVAAENDITKRVVFLNAPEVKVVSQSEEHLVFETGTDHRFKPGDILYGLPYHICPSVALYERVITIENGKITGEWMNVARDRRIKN